LPEPIFTPATKAEVGHDENITFERACDIVGGELMQTLRDHTLAVYQMGHAHAEKQGIILADTKLEFGRPLDSENDEPILIDEVLTPDSSRFWPADEYAVGRDQSSFDKQYVRNYLETLVADHKWKKQPPGPVLPKDVVQNTAEKYQQAYRLLTGLNLPSP
jgi:phosphoribosylaminoimidazole-succinocarboxamide synthase